MSKITFRADDDLVGRLEGFDASKSEVMREALRAYLDAERDPDAVDDADHVDGADPEGDALADRVAALVDARLAERRLDATAPPADADNPPASPDVNVSITLEGVRADDDRVEEGTTVERDRRVGTPDPTDRGRKTADANDPPTPVRDEPAGSCEQCGETLTADQVFCPNCGEKASHRAFCECGTELRSDWAFCPACGRRTPAAHVLDSG